MDELKDVKAIGKALAELDGVLMLLVARAERLQCRMDVLKAEIRHLSDDVGGEIEKIRRELKERA